MWGKTMVRLTKDEKSQLAYELEHRLYFLYIDWPDNPVPAHHWMTRDGEVVAMESMSLDHLKASATLAQNALDGFVHDRRSGGGGASTVIEALRPIAKRKIAELREILLEKANA